MKKNIRSYLVVFACAAVSACGFHLRNADSSPSALEPIYIGGPAGNSTLASVIRYQLKNSNTAVTLYSAEANYQLWLISEGQEQRIISLDRRGLAAEYGIATSVEFELRDKSGKRVLGPQKIEERRTITNNPDNALTTAQDVGLVSSGMEQAIAQQVVRRLGAYSTHALKNPRNLSTEPVAGDAEINNENTGAQTNAPRDTAAPATVPNN